MKGRELAAGERQRGTLVRLVLAVLIVAALAAGGYSLYAWQQHKIDALNIKINELNTQIELLRNSSPQQQAPSYIYHSEKGVQLNVYLPKNGTKITSPLVIIGEVPGNWSFEAAFPVVIKDSKGNVVASSPAQVLGDWMTDQMVPFTAKLEFPAEVSGTGTIALQKDNPSGEAKNADSVTIPISF